MSPRSLSPRLVAALALLSTAGCMLDSKPAESPTAGGSDEIDTRVAVDRTGRPMPSARVLVQAAGDSTGTTRVSAATDSLGRYPVLQLPDGYYTLVVRDSSGDLGRYVDSLHLIAHKLPNARDTLLPLGSVSGHVRLQPDDPATSVTVGMVGTDILANADSSGAFRIELVPGGLYTLGAQSRLDGYQAVYRRIQLASGQNLVLSDTLVLPFSGLPAPTGLRAVQDTATGNVSVRWNSVHSPDLLGYVVERVENGVVGVSRYATDTTWTDSLGAYWEGLPILGPWPVRDVAYRVRARSASGEPDTKNRVVQLAAQPPAWTGRMSAPTGGMELDSAKHVVRWTFDLPRHPDVVDWAVARFIDGTEDCRDTLSAIDWTDSACGAPVGRGSASGSPSSLRLMQAKITFELLPSRQRGQAQAFRVGGSVEERDSTVFVQWRDSGAGTGSGIVSLSQVGDWIEVDHSDGTRLVSRAGTRWIEVPSPLVAAWEDTLWCAMTIDKTHLAVGRRTMSVDWAWDTLVSDTMPRITQITAGPDGLLGFDIYRSVLFRWTPGAFTPFVPQSGTFQYYWFGFYEFPVDSCAYLEIDLFSIDGIANWTQWTQVRGGVKVSKVATGMTRYLGAFGSPAILYGYSRSASEGGDGSRLAVQTVAGETWDVPFPIDSVATTGVAAVFHDEIWTVIDGHLWKGTLHLPSP